MLKNLHIRNMALIREMDIDFHEGLNILTGETGAGKSIVIGSVMAALGMQSAKGLIRDDGVSLVELAFSGIPKEAQRLLADEGFEGPFEEVVLTRRFSNGKSTCRVNGETASMSLVKKLGTELIDIHGQHEFQQLLKGARQLQMIDRFGGEAVERRKAEHKEAYRSFREALRAKEALSMDPKERARTLDLLTFEAEELRKAALKSGEDEELERLYKTMSESDRILQGIARIDALTGNDGTESAGTLIGRSIKEMESLSQYDPNLLELTEVLRTSDGLLSDFHRELLAYGEGLARDPEALKRTEERLNTINRLKKKYGNTIEAVLRKQEEIEAEVDRLQRMETESEEAERRLREAEDRVDETAAKLSVERKEAAARFSEAVKEQLLDLNFAQGEFEVLFGQKEEIGENGSDEVTFILSTNPGEELRPLTQVASGGELSRIMLGIRAMFAERDENDCLIFDEVDAGISGRTAQKVAEKLDAVSLGRQAVCITHLPQIAAMADHHYGIEKVVEDGQSMTRIRELSDADAVAELSRLIGGMTITEQTKLAAAEMKEQSRNEKKERRS